MTYTHSTPATVDVLGGRIDLLSAILAHHHASNDTPVLVEDTHGVPTAHYNYPTTDITPLEGAGATTRYVCKSHRFYAVVSVGATVTVAIWSYDDIGALADNRDPRPLLCWENGAMVPADSTHLVARNI